MYPNITYATKAGCRDRVGDYSIPDIWWSRKFEYPWASQFATPGCTVIDAGCGVEHPFKQYLADQCSHCYAVDVDTRINDLADHPRLTPVVASLDAIPLNIEVDRVFCISVLEHLDRGVIEGAMNEFARRLRPGGMAVITLDTPPLLMTDWCNIVESSDFQAPDSFKALALEEPADVLVSPPHFNFRRVFCCVLSLKN